MSHDSGGKIRLKLQPGVRGDALFSTCGRYRHWLSRFWNDDDHQSRWSECFEPYALWIGINPSTAEADVDDPTIRKEMHFTRAMGLSGYVKCNVMDYRTTYPVELLRPGVQPCSNENHHTIKRLADNAAVIVAAWGVLDKPLRHLATSVTLMLSDKRLMCMGLTKDGSPRHPLYLRNDSVPIGYREAK